MGHQASAAAAPLVAGVKEALRQFPAGRVVMVDEFRTSRVSSADNTPSETLPDTPPESFRYGEEVGSVPHSRNRFPIRLLPPTRMLM
ncbi:hypothetical protein QJQ45_000311 [Haematococcus lacustris]|nr:hypothetical protein QJQ45_000311 [Haematococcus lacustris]